MSGEGLNCGRLWYNPLCYQVSAQHPQRILTEHHHLWGRAKEAPPTHHPHPYQQETISFYICTYFRIDSMNIDAYSFNLFGEVWKGDWFLQRDPVCKDPQKSNQSE